MIDDLQAAVEDLVAEPPRAVLIRAEGRATSAGADVHVFDGLTPAEGSRLWDELLGTIDRLEALPAADRLRRPRDHPHRGLRDRARL